MGADVTPLHVPVKSGVVTSPFGVRVDPFDRVEKLHAGVDFAPRGDKLVLNAQAGVIKDSGFNSVRGNYIVVEADVKPGEPRRELHYWHLASLIQHKVGLRVPARLALGIIGKTGRATGEHLHFEVRELRGGSYVAVDPGDALGLVGLSKGAKVSNVPQIIAVLFVVMLVGCAAWAMGK